MKLTVILANGHETYCRLMHENELVPYSKRAVQIELTPEQMEKIKPRMVGESRGEKVFEFICESFLEIEPQPK